MATSLTENYNDLCRICASKTSVLDGINIFESEGNAREINKKVSSCLPIQIHEADELPKMICAECVYKLDLLFNFREKSLQTENLLISLIKKVHLNPINPKINEQKIICNNQQINITQALNHQQLDLQNQELLGQTTNIIHELSKDESMTVDEDIILNTQNIDINHPLDSIALSTHELQTDDMSNAIHSQQLNLQHAPTIGELVEDDLHLQHSQNLEFIRSQHNIIVGQYDHPVKVNEENKMPIMGMKNENELDIKAEQEIKNEGLNMKELSSDPSDSDDSSDLDFDPNLESAAGEIIKNDDSNENQYYIENQLYEQPKHEFFNTSEIASIITTNGTLWFYCSVCGKSHEDEEKFLIHYSEHINKCILCDITFNNIEEFHTHKKDVHSAQVLSLEESKPPKIDSPKTRTRLKPQTNKNKNSNSNEGSDESDNDPLEIGTNDEDEQDEEEDKNTKRKRCEPKVCKECGKQYKTNYKLQEHMRKHTGEQPYKCSTCDKAFRSKIGLAQHEAKHTGQYDYSCSTCGKGFQCRSYLIVHQRVHSDLKPYPCTTCGSNFKTKQSLLDHMNRHLGVKPYLCEICGRGFITKGLWKSHQKVHSGMDNRQYPCTVCNKMFVSKSYLATHLRIHTGEKPFMCEVCGKGFLTRVDLRIHSTMHTGEKSFVCEMCGKAFARRDALRCHRRSHTGERPYKCDVCGQTFTQFSPMAIHKRLHTGERPYSCEVCSKAFVSRSTMMSHRKKHVT